MAAWLAWLAFGACVPCMQGVQCVRCVRCGAVRNLVGRQTGACSEALPYPLNRMRLYYAFGATRSSSVMCKCMRRSCKTGWMDDEWGCMGEWMDG
eukprot:365475-Chlamydomonas_euryale.AAC.12